MRAGQRGLVVGCLAAGLVATSGCGAAGPGGGSQQPPTSRSGSISVGETVDTFVYTHCGVESARINGRWWHAVDPLYGPGGAGSGPPAGWQDPQQEGELTLQSSSRAAFAARGEQVVLVPAPTDEPLRICA